MDVLHQDALVFEDVTLGLQVETVVPGGQRQAHVNTSGHLREKI